MKATARYTQPNPRLVMLGDLYGDPPMAGITWNGGELFHEQSYSRGEFIDVFDDQNERNEFSWTVWRQQNSLADAFQFVLDHTAELRGLALVEFTFTPEDGPSFSRFMVNAKVVARMLGKLAVSNQWQYTVIGGEIHKANPNI